MFVDFSKAFLLTNAPTLQKRKSSTLLDARMAKIYRQQRHSRDGDDSASDDDDDDDDDYDEGLLTA